AIPPYTPRTNSGRASPTCSFAWASAPILAARPPPTSKPAPALACRPPGKAASSAPATAPPSTFPVACTETSPRPPTAQFPLTDTCATPASSSGSTKTTRPDARTASPFPRPKQKTLRIRRSHDGWRKNRRDNRPLGLAGPALSGDLHLEGAPVRVLRTQEFQFLVLFRLPGAAGAGDPDCHRHLPGHALQARRRTRVPVGRVHHA